MRDAKKPSNPAYWVAATVAIPVLLLLASEKSRHNHQAAGTAGTESESAIAVNASRPTSALQPVAVPPLQQGVSADEVNHVIMVGTSSESPGFEPPELDVKAGEIVQLEFTNNSDPKLNYQHGWVLAKPGALESVGQSASQSGAQRGWVASSADVLARTDVIPSGETTSIVFRAPMEPGDYPYLCPSSRHWTSMHGTLHVSPAANGN